MASGIRGNFDPDTPYSDLQSRLLVTCGLSLSLNYSIPEQEWLALSGNIHGIVSQGNLSLKTSEERRKALGTWETIRSFFGKKYYLTTQQWSMDTPILVDTCVALYGLLYDLEEVSSPKLTDAKAEQWFTKEFAKRNVATAMKNSGTALQMALEEIWVDLFRQYHPNTLDLPTRINTPQTAENQTSDQTELLG